MTVLFWIAAGLLLLVGVPGAISFAAYLSTGEPVPLARAKAAWRWAVVIVLGTFNIIVFKRVVEGIRAIWF